MKPNENDILNRIPIAVSLDTEFNQPYLSPSPRSDKKRLLYIAAPAIAIALLISFVAMLLVFLIDLITNLSFHQTFLLASSSPAAHSLRPGVILIPALKELSVGLMVLYGSKAILSHCIPEAMEQILTSKNKIRPSLNISLLQFDKILWYDKTIANINP